VKLDPTEKQFLDELDRHPEHADTLMLLGDWYADHEQTELACACWWLTERSLYPWCHPFRGRKPWFFWRDDVQDRPEHARLPREVFCALKNVKVMLRSYPVRFFTFKDVLEGIVKARQRLRQLLLVRGET
jgi:hypothetical protein